MRIILFHKIICLVNGLTPQRVQDMFCTKRILYSSYKITSSKITLEFADGTSSILELFLVSKL